MVAFLALAAAAAASSATLEGTADNKMRCRLDSKGRGRGHVSHTESASQLNAPVLGYGFGFRDRAPAKNMRVDLHHAHKGKHIYLESTPYLDKTVFYLREKITLFTFFLQLLIHL